MAAGATADHHDIFNMFFGVGSQRQHKDAKAKADLAAKLAAGEIDMATFNAAFGALM